MLSISEECLTDGHLSESMKGTATRLIYKRRGDIKNLKNWRPTFSVKCGLQDYFTLCLSRVLHNIIDPDQTFSVPGRSIFSNLFLIRDVLDYIAQTGETVILLTLDQEKAFDHVNWSFLMDLLRHLGFGPVFCKWPYRLFYMLFASRPLLI